MVQILSEINLRMASELEERFLARPTSSKVGTELTNIVELYFIQILSILVLYLYISRWLDFNNICCQQILSKMNLVL